MLPERLFYPLAVALAVIATAVMWLGASNAVLKVLLYACLLLIGLQIPFVAQRWDRFRGRTPLPDEDQPST
jgi:ABC-type transport system involved in cytochrome bd biosynthesis fused ATPase/permease subunit